LDARLFHYLSELPAEAVLSTSASPRERRNHWRVADSRVLRAGVAKSAPKGITDKADQLNKLRQDVEGALKKGLVARLSTELTDHAQVSGLNRVAIYSFFVGIILLGIFVAHNLLATTAT
jgi:hypothetical protein